jgi:hypothetical protein
MKIIKIEPNPQPKLQIESCLLTVTDSSVIHQLKLLISSLEPEILKVDAPQKKKKSKWS